MIVIILWPPVIIRFMNISRTVIDLTVLLERMALSSVMKKISKMTVTLSKFAPALVRAQECLARMCISFH